MRTTLNLDDQLAKRARLEATRTGSTLTALLEEGLARLLDRREAERGRPELPIWRGSTAAAGIDFDDSSAIWEALDSNGS